jgi:hypothetical protein
MFLGLVCLFEPFKILDPNFDTIIVKTYFFVADKSGWFIFMLLRMKILTPEITLSNSRATFLSVQNLTLKLKLFFLLLGMIYIGVKEQ